MDLGALRSALSKTATRTVQRSAPSEADFDTSSTANATGASRIAAALLGAENWHEESRRPAPTTRTVLLRVAHAPAVVVRAAPHLDAPVVTFCRVGTTLLAVARRDLWVRLALANFPESSWPEAWLLLSHPEHGRLVDLLSGAVEELPISAAALPSAAAAAAAEPCTETVRVVRRLMRVVHTPHVLVRARPSLAASACGYRKHGALLACDAECGDWVRLVPITRPASLAPVNGASQRGAETEQARCDAGTAAEEWVLTVHPELGRLLEATHPGL